jgi:predicted RNase H-like HicB family nuclease
MSDKYYFAVFCPEDGGGYTVWFPDVPEANTQGDDLGEAMFMAADALRESLEEYVAARKDIPQPSSLEDVQASAAATIKELGIVPCGPLAYPPIAIPNLDATPVKLGISMPRNVLAEIDRKAKLNGMTRSGFLAAAALAWPAAAN